VPLAVLDTNAVLDWLLFADPGIAGLGEALAAGRVRWVATEAMRAELDDVLRRGLAEHWSADAGRIADHWQRLSQWVGAPADPAPLRCADPDDQKFLDLAVAVGARWLSAATRRCFASRARPRCAGFSSCRQCSVSV
jgi:predicted nucleic acid-binding protein